MQDEKAWFFASAIILSGAVFGWNFVSAFSAAGNRTLEISIGLLWKFPVLSIVTIACTASLVVFFFKVRKKRILYLALLAVIVLGPYVMISFL